MTRSVFDWLVMRYFPKRRCIDQVLQCRTFSAIPNEADAMASRIQSLQSAYEMSLPANQPYIVRLDGVAFRNYTAGLLKPFDARLTHAMLLTTRDLLAKCSARTAFCQSDEISLVFAGEPMTKNIVYAGRVQKIVSVMAGWAAARFNLHISEMDWEQAEAEAEVGTAVKARVASSSAVFDARVFSAPTDMMAADGIIIVDIYDFSNLLETCL
ncbi:hypothetical protein PSACC_00785 [Paramicrosporidium saccamoebae]|uniref:tRNA(His) guanylyltransferase n=1 Tax=Paramicrosporidium saccamoebae TaxID=1246581 RepID=A0A2H9TNQ3_9FUNG|nr:hypothetical protein PSACC_00785 [Paramicrosporidium saccamoebae]